VTHFQAGDEVFGETIKGFQWTNGGAYAEHVSVSEDSLALKPANVTFDQAAAVPTFGLIALQNLPNEGRLHPGQSVLVNGAGGGVGTIAVQFAKAYGANVTGVDDTSKLDMVRSLGTDRVIDYTKEDFTQSSERYDLIFDIPGNHISPFVSQLPTPNFSMPNKKDSMAVLREFLEAGKLMPVIDRRYSLGEVPEAIRYLEKGHARGKVVITVRDDKGSAGG
jgi:NADPH:quinone reductase-like Zn-dependent oxidoreductase